MIFAQISRDFEDAIDFMNLVFSAHGPIDFTQLLPALYQPTDEQMGWNWAVRENGRIRAVVGYLSTITVVLPSVTVPALPSLIAFAASRRARSATDCIAESGFSLALWSAAWASRLSRRASPLKEGLLVIWSTPCRGDLGQADGATQAPPHPAVDHRRRLTAKAQTNGEAMVAMPHFPIALPSASPARTAPVTSLTT